jgi:FkbM family methyltransferase
MKMTFVCKKQLLLSMLVFGQASLLQSREIEVGSVSVYHARPYLPANPVVLEAGAHAGGDTILMSRNFPSGKVYAFEPVPFLYEQLTKAVSAISNVSTYPFALAGQAGTAEMFISGGAGTASSSLLNPVGHLELHPQITFNERVAVPTVTIDQWAAQNGVTHIDLLWLDLQGAEFEVLKASPEILKTVRVIITEISFMQMYQGTPLYPEFKKWLEEQGFVVIREDRQYQDMGDALLIRKDLLAKE